MHLLYHSFPTDLLRPFSGMAHWSRQTIGVVQAAVLKIYEMCSTNACFCALIIREAILMCSCGVICTVGA